MRLVKKILKSRILGDTRMLKCETVIQLASYDTSKKSWFNRGYKLNRPLTYCVCLFACLWPGFILFFVLVVSHDIGYFEIAII